MIINVQNMDGYGDKFISILKYRIKYVV